MRRAFDPLRPPDPPAPDATAFTLPDVTVIVPGQPAVPGQDLTVRHGRIQHLTASGSQPAPAPVLERFRHAYVLPGLVDMHSHLPAASALRMSGLFLLLHLAHGVTTVRDAGDLDGTAVPAARRLLADGHPGPRLSTAGAFVTAGAPRWSNSHLLSGPRDAADAVARLADAGNEWVKAYENLEPATIRALVDAAARRGLGVLGHVPTQLRHEQALLPDSQHFFGVPLPEDLQADTVVCRASDWHGVDERRIDQIVATSVLHRLAHTPTLVTACGLLTYRDPTGPERPPGIEQLPSLFPDVLWHPDRGIPAYRGLTPGRLASVEDALSRKLRLVGRLHAAGVRLHLGTDTLQPFVAPGLALHQEMRLFGRAGISAADVWRLATVDAARTIAPHTNEPSLGLIQPSAPADFLIYDHDPTTGLDPASGLHAVTSRGHLYLKSTLDDAVRRHSGHHRQPHVRLIGNIATRRQLRKTSFRR